MLKGRTRVLNACQRCRRQKIKCSGSPHCRTCRARGLSCDWGSEDKQILVSEKELFELRNKVNQLENRYSASPTLVAPSHGREEPSKTSDDIALSANLAQPDNLQLFSHSESQLSSAELNDERYLGSNADNGAIDVCNPLAPIQPAYIQEPSGKLRYLGHSSTYAFTQQVLHILQQTPPSNPSPEIIMSPNMDGTTFKAENFRLTPLIEPDISGLPSRDIALHYLQCIKFRTQPLFFLFDEVDFTFGLQQFYKDALPYARSNPIWYAHYLILMAFGKALDPHKQLLASPATVVPEYLSRALRLLPDMTYLTDDLVEATEVFSCIALYLQSIDHRHAAISYIGLALRMAHLYRLHLGLEESIIGRHGVQRCRRVWCTVYALNNKLTSNNGLPNFINNQDGIKALPPFSEVYEDDNASHIHLKICQLLSHSINKIYCPSEEDRISFVSTTRTILRGAASIADELKQYSKDCFGEISRVTAHLELAYHHCIILACRPALFCLGRLRSENLRGEYLTSPSSALKGLVQVCIDSAIQAENILDQLKKHNLLDTFLPFDLECSFSAALVITMASHLLPQALPPTYSTQNVKEVISAIATRGNIQAKIRYMEIKQLEELLQQQTQQLQQTRQSNVALGTDESIMAAGDGTAGPERFADYGNLFFDGWDFNDGFHGHQMINLAEALGPEDLRLLG